MLFKEGIVVCSNVKRLVLIKDHAMKVYGGMEARAYLTLEIDDDVWSASRPGPCTYCIGGWVGPRAGLDAVEKRKIFTRLHGITFRQNISIFIMATICLLEGDRTTTLHTLYSAECLECQINYSSENTWKEGVVTYLQYIPAVAWRQINDVKHQDCQCPNRYSSRSPPECYRRTNFFDISSVKT
jgi:hypothetical protein